MRLIFNIILFTLCLSTSYSQQIGKLVEASHNPASPFTIIAMGTNDGIPQNQISALTSDNFNNLIIGTANGYCTFNGQSFRTIANNDKAKWILPKHIYYEKSSKAIYCIDHRNMEYIVSPTVRLISKLPFVASSFYNDSIIGITASGKLYKGKIGTGKYKHFATAPKTKKFIAVGWIENQPYVGTDNLTYLFVNRQWKTLIDNPIIKVKVNPYTKQTYAFGMNSVYVYKNKNLVSLGLEFKRNQVTFSDIAFSKNKEIFISSDKGLFYLHNNEIENITYETGLPSQVFYNLHYIEQEDVLFVGTGDRGLLQLKVKQCLSYLNQDGIGRSSLCSVIESKKNEIVVAGTYNTIYKKGQKRLDPYYIQLFNYSCIENVNDEIWAGSWGAGLIKLKEGKKVGSIDRYQLSNGIVHSIFQDSKKRIWIGTENGITLINNGKIIKYFKPEYNFGLVIFIKERENGDIIIGGEDGISILNKAFKRIIHINRKKGLKAKEVRSIYELSKDRFLIGTYGGGIFYYNKGKLVSINAMENCHLDIDAFTLAPDKRGNLYISTNHGLYLVGIQEILRFVEGKTEYLIPFSLGETDGILNSEFNGGFQNNYLCASNGFYYFPSIQGLVETRFEVPKFRKLKPQLDQLYVNDEEVSFSDNQFDRKTHTITFKYHCTNYSTYNNLRYQYKLEGPDLKQGWSSLERHGSVSFKMLPPGRYVVYIRGIDGFNDPNPQNIRYEFTIKKYFYEELAFKIVVIAILFFVIFIIFYTRTQSNKRKELKEIEIRNSINELKINAIQSKMNPHFVFNCLNNIQNLIVLGKTDEAQIAMSDFSALLRKFLQQSEYTFIQLNEEISVLKSYLRVEKFRFEDEIQVTIDVPNSIGFYFIPTLLIQPTVENAIIHGLNHKKGEKILSIKAYVKNNTLCIEIEDNGIGREASSQINTYRKGHVSHGGKIIQDKIELLHERYGYSIKFETIDKPNGGGTLVKFKVPILTEDVTKN